MHTNYTTLIQLLKWKKEKGSKEEGKNGKKEKEKQNQRNKIVSTEKDPKSVVDWFLTKMAKAMQRSKAGLFNKWCCNNWTSTC